LSYIENGTIRIALSQASPLIQKNRGNERNWVEALANAAVDPAFPLSRQEIIDALAADPPSTVVHPLKWLGQQQAKASAASEEESDLYADPAGTNWGPEIGALNKPWREWTFEVTGAECRRRCRIWGVAVKAAWEGKDLTALEAGPPVEVPA
jgi:hypothetical protein